MVGTTEVATVTAVVGEGMTVEVMEVRLFLVFVHFHFTLLFFLINFFF